MTNKTSSELVSDTFRQKPLYQTVGYSKSTKPLNLTWRKDEIRQGSLCYVRIISSVLNERVAHLIMKVYTVLTCFLTLLLQPFWMSARDGNGRKHSFLLGLLHHPSSCKLPNFRSLLSQPVPQLLACRNRYGIVALLSVNCFCFSGSELISMKKMSSSPMWLKQLHPTDFVWWLCAHTHTRERSTTETMKFVLCSSHSNPATFKLDLNT